MNDPESTRVPPLMLRQAKMWRRSILAFSVLVCASNEAQCDAGVVISYLFEGEADVTVDGVFNDQIPFEVLFSIDQDEVDQFPGDSSRGAFANGLAILSLPTESVENRIVTNVTGLRQDQNPGSIYLTETGSYFNTAFGFGLPGGAIPDVNQLGPLVGSPVTPDQWYGAGLVWQLDNGTQVRFNEGLNLRISNVASVPEPSAIIFFILASAVVGYTRIRAFFKSPVLSS